MFFLNISLFLKEQASVSRCSHLSRLNQVTIYGLMTSDLNYFSSILNAAPNLFRLDMSFNYLLKLFEDQKMCHLFNQRITSLSILPNDHDTSSTTLSEEHIPVIASTFSRLRDLYINFKHLPCSKAIPSKEDDLDDTMDQSDQQKYKVISTDSSESFLVCLLANFKEHQLISLAADGQFDVELKTDVEQWLRNNTVICEQLFSAVFDKILDEVHIWM